MQHDWWRTLEFKRIEVRHGATPERSFRTLTFSRPFDAGDFTVTFDCPKGPDNTLIITITEREPQ